MPDTLQISYSLDDIAHAAHQFWQYAYMYRIFAFNGEMGAGKTTFIHALCNVLGVKDHVSSPTFALINEYLISEQRTVNDEQLSKEIIYHMDWYRLKNNEEAIQAGMEDCLNQKNAICFIEWPEKALQLLPRPYVWADIEVLNDRERKMIISVRQ
jgi:tRNA threonylcarbamoyladenosine biosynthesis protein TsaE